MAGKTSKASRRVFKSLGISAAMLAVILVAFSVLKISLKEIPCANSVSCVKDISGEFDTNVKNAEFMGKNMTIPEYLAEKRKTSKVLGEVPSSSKRIEIDLSTQTLYAFQNNEEVMSFPISSGKWFPTPTGTFHIWLKLRFTRMTGGEGDDYYDLPNVPYVMFFYNDQVSKGRGFGLHGAYWHNNFGYPMSHGCINIAPANAAKLYDWASPLAEKNVTYASEENPGTEVVIYGKPLR